MQIYQALKDVFGEQYTELIEILDNSGTIISGSFILGAILGEQYKDGDIDFYTPILDIKTNTDDRPYTSLEKFFDKYGKFDSYYASERYGDVLGNQIKWIRSYIINGKKVQSIHMDVSHRDLLYFVYDSFDFDICKVSL